VGGRIVLSSFAEGCRAMSETDFRKEMHAFTVPTLIIHGDADQGAPIDLTGRKTAEAISGSQLKLYEGAAHGLFITEKDRLNADLLALIQSYYHQGAASFQDGHGVWYGRSTPS
jgi:pimeloyl-ACP methyl ester carboxylesterase